MALSHAGYFDRPLTNLNSLRALAPLDDESISIEQRARSYLAVNCAHCHQPGGPGLAIFDARLAPSLTATRLVNGILNNTRGDADARLVVPESLDHSMLYQRLIMRGSGKMPPLATSLVDTQAVALVARWITQDLAGYRTFADWQILHFGSTTDPAAQATADPDGDNADNLTEYLTGTIPTDPSSLWQINVERSGGRVQISYPSLANRLIQMESSTRIYDATSWQALDLPENRPLARAISGTLRLPPLPVGPPDTFYRGRVHEP
jgi:mono/diheme cytochrome c family protein